MTGTQVKLVMNVTVKPISDTASVYRQKTSESESQLSISSASESARSVESLATFDIARLESAEDQ